MAHDPFGGLTGWDLEGFHNGGDTELWKRLGAFQCTVEDDERGPIEGVRFAVWAPNARAVQVIGDFNWWTGDPMQLIPGSGVWGTFIEGLKEETLYKFRIQGPDGVWREKVDPLARFSEQAPANASIVYESKYIWSDDEWIAKREKSLPYKEPMSIYEVVYETRNRPTHLRIPVDYLTGIES